MVICSVESFVSGRRLAGLLIFTLVSLLLPGCTYPCQTCHYLMKQCCQFSLASISSEGPCLISFLALSDPPIRRAMAWVQRSEILVCTNSNVCIITLFSLTLWSSVRCAFPPLLCVSPHLKPHSPETTEHFILRCPKYAHECWALTRHLRDNSPKLEDILSNTKTVIPLINYIEATGRFADR